MPFLNESKELTTELPIELKEWTNNEIKPQHMENPNAWDPNPAKMAFAYWIFIGITVEFIGACIAHWNYKYELSSILFEIFKTGLLPIVTLIIGYYFSKSEG
jgi:hypothetical protein